MDRQTFLVILNALSRAVLKLETVTQCKVTIEYFVYELRKEYPDSPPVECQLIDGMLIIEVGDDNSSIS